MKRFFKHGLCLAVILLIACLTLLPTEANAASVDDLTFTLNSDGSTYSVTDCYRFASGSLTIPATYDGKPVTTIGGEAFAGCNDLVRITIPHSVTVIGCEAFYSCDNLTYISIPDSITTIEDYAFGDCYSLQYNIYGNAKYLGNSSNPYVVLIESTSTGITQCTIHKNTKLIFSEAFCGCDNLTNITIPGGVIYIGYDAFSYCDSLTGIKVAADNTNYSSDSYGVLFNKDKTILIQAPGAISGRYTIPDSVTHIDDSAFYYCKNLTGVALLNNVTSIGGWAFLNCDSLTNITIPDSVTSIGLAAFNYCNSLKTVYFGGDQSQWAKIAMGPYNEPLETAEVIFNYITYNRSATVIKTSGANVWSKPYTSGDSVYVRTAAYETKVNVVTKYTNPSGGLWYKLSDGNWVYSTNVRITDYNPADVQPCNKIFVVTSWGANIWSKPYSSGDSKVIKSVEKTAALSIVAQVRNSTYGLWYQLADGGWVYSHNVTERLYDPAKVIAFNRSATVMVTGGANIWGQPSTSSPSKVARVAKYQSKLTVVAKYTTPAGGLWYQLTDGNWVYGNNIRITDYNPADVETYNKTIVVTSWGANIWSKPYSSGDSRVIKTVPKDAKLSVVAKVRNSTYGLWYQLSDGSWVYSHNVAVK